MASIIYMASIHKKRGLFQKLNKEPTQVLKIQWEEMDAEMQMLFCLMLLNNSCHSAKLLRSRKTKHKQTKEKAFWVWCGFKEESH